MRQVEIILLKQLASCVAIPMFVVGPDGDLVFFNEPAEPLVGERFDEIGELGRDDWPDALRMTDESGGPIREDDRPVISALNRRQPVHRRIWTRGLDGARHALAGTGIPLIALDGSLLGALGMFWEPGTGQGAVPSAPQEVHEVETILMRRLAGYLAVPIFIADSQGALLYFNAAAEPFFGCRLDEVVGVPPAEFFASLQPTDEDGSPLKPEEHPAWIAGTRGEPAHRRFSNRGLDGSRHSVEATAIPLVGQAGNLHGAVGFFWELRNS